MSFKNFLIISLSNIKATTNCINATENYYKKKEAAFLSAPGGKYPSYANKYWLFTFYILFIFFSEIQLFTNFC